MPILDFSLRRGVVEVVDLLKAFGAAHPPKQGWGGKRGGGGGGALVFGNVRARQIDTSKRFHAAERNVRVKLGCRGKRSALP